MQESDGALPGQLGRLRMISILAVFLKEPMAGPRIGIEGGRAVCAFQVFFQFLDHICGFIRI